MANEVKFLIKDLIINSANDETTITDIFKNIQILMQKEIEPMFF